MKRIFYLLLGVFMFWSCAETYEYRDVLEEAKNAPKEISFDNLFSVRTKAVIENLDSLRKQELGIYAKILGASNITLPVAQDGFLINNDTLSYASGWSCKKRYFWPKMAENAGRYQRVNFFAYGPVTIGKPTNDNGFIKIDVNAQGMNNDAIDLIYDKELRLTYDSIDGSKKAIDRIGYVDFKMEHQLAWISFQAKYTTEFDSIWIDSIIVKADTTTAVFKINTRSSANENVPADSAVLVKNGSSSFEYKFTPKDIKIDSLYKRVADFIAIPQVVSDDMTATIVYTVVIDSVKYSNSKTVVKLNAGKLGEKHTHGNLALSDSIDSCKVNWRVPSWEAAYKYTYHINFDWQEILFDAKVTTWLRVDDGGYYRIY